MNEKFSGESGAEDQLPTRDITKYLPDQDILSRNRINSVVNKSSGQSRTTDLPVSDNSTWSLFTCCQLTEAIGKSTKEEQKEARRRGGGEPWPGPRSPLPCCQRLELVNSHNRYWRDPKCSLRSEEKLEQIVKWYFYCKYLLCCQHSSDKNLGCEQHSPYKCQPDVSTLATESFCGCIAIRRRQK